MGLLKLITSFLLVLLFAFAIVSFAIDFADNNDASITLSNDSDFVTLRTNIIEEETTFFSDVNISVTEMDKSTVSTQTEATEGGTSFKQVPKILYRQTKNVIIIPFGKIFGYGSDFSIFLTMLLGILMIGVVVYIYKAWAGRNPD